jgi:hypothetical protein
MLTMMTLEGQNYVTGSLVIPMVAEGGVGSV